MLQNLHVKNLALINEVDIELKPGLNILTGETGAGKSIIIGSVNLALGARYNADILRKGAESGFVELSFYVKNPRQIARLKELEVIPEEGMIVLSRKFMEGRSVSRINGETVTVGKLKQAAEILIDIHGQHEHQSLLYKKNHLTILDAFAKEETLIIKDKLKPAYERYRSCQLKLKDDNMGDEERRREAALIQYEIDEIKAAQLDPGEDEAIEEQYRRMVNSKKISERVAEAYSYTSDAPEQNASDLLSHAIRSLKDCAGDDQMADDLCEQLVEVDGLLNDFNRALSEYEKSLEFSPEEFYEIESRLNLINHLKSKYGNTVEIILSYCEGQEQRLEELNHYEQHLEQLKQEYENAKDELQIHTDHLTRVRREKSGQLSAVIEQGLQDLNFADVRFQIEVRELPEFTKAGKDEVEFMVSLNPGETLKSLGEIASGGELSRIMLAIKTVLADKDDTETLIFDEIDTGISGRTAQKVSEKMAVLAADHQVICITHLAQIAAMADAHYLIEKTVQDNATRTDICLLNESESIRELARILGGAEITESVLNNAAEMKELAAKCK
ncbi:MAG: DNA repair protein RecN [Lachnospiraceae bacterium]